MSTPIWIGERSALAFGWYHPAAGDQREVGVVLCAPLGYEAMCSHRSIRLLAEALAVDGFPVVRFDYHGTGDSAGEDTDSERLTAWKTSILAAVDAMQRNSGLRRVVLFGLRFGGTLALSVAAEHDDIAAVIAWAPFVSGKAFVRELRAFTMLKGEDQGTRDYIEASGFLVPSASVAELQRLDLTTLAKRPAPKVLLLQRDSTSNEAKIAAHLSTIGSQVQTELVPGYGAMMRDPHEAVVPHDVIARVRGWLGQAFPERSGAGISGPLSLHDHPVGGALEQPLFFGPDAQLFGILTTSPQWVRTRPMVLLLNTGSNHHVGSHRMSVTLARRLAKLGFASFRFDIAGLGDSVLLGEARGKRHYAPDAVGDVQAAMALLRAGVGASKFVIVGLCSGAYLGLNSTAQIDSVVGQVIINLQAAIFDMERTPSSTIAYKSNQHYREMLLKPETYRRLLKGRINVRGITKIVVSRALTRAKARVLDIFHALPANAPRNEVEAMFSVIADRGSDSMLIFSSDDSGIDQLYDALGDRLDRLRERPNFHYRILDNADHTFTRHDARTRLLEIVVGHINAKFG